MSSSMSLEPASPPSSIDSGMAVLILLLRFHGLAAEPQQIAHQYGRSIGVNEMLRCAKDLKLKARVVNSDWKVE